MDIVLVFKDANSFNFMRLDSEAAIVEILPYLGTLDQAYRVISQTNRKMRKFWEENMQMFDKIIEFCYL